MKNILVLDSLSTCHTEESIISMLDEMLGKDATVEQRTIALHTFMGVRQSFYFGKPLSPDQEYKLSLEQVTKKNGTPWYD